MPLSSQSEENAACGTHGSVLVSREIGKFRVSVTVHAPELRLSKHDHEQASINLVMDGGLVEVVGGQSVVQEPGSGSVKPSGAHHANMYGNRRVSCVLLEFGEDELPVPEFQVLNRGSAWGSGVDLMREMAIGGPGGEDLEQSCYALIGGLKGGVSPRMSAPWMKRIIEIINDDLTRAHSASELATEVGIHPSHLCRSFRSQFGRTPGQYQREVRVARSLEAVRSRSQSMSVIAHELGFADQSHFVRSFKSVIGVSPGSFRKRVQSVES